MIWQQTPGGMCVCACVSVCCSGGGGAYHMGILHYRRMASLHVCTVKIIRIVVMTTVVCYGVGDDEHIKYIDTAR